MARRKIDDEINIKRGKRLKECLEFRHYKQNQFAKLVNASPNLISLQVQGKRSIPWDRVKDYAKVLQVSPLYLMLESDVMLDRQQHTLDYELFGQADRSLIEYLIAMGCDLYFYVVKLYDGRFPEEIENLSDNWEYEPYNWDSLNIKASFSQLREFCLSDYKCKYVEGESVSEVVIKRVVINNVAFDYGSFVFIMQRLIDYIKFTVDHLKDFKFDFGYCRGIQSALENDIHESRSCIGGLIDIADLANHPQMKNEKVMSPDGIKMTLAEYIKNGYYKTLKKQDELEDEKQT